MMVRYTVFFNGEQVKVYELDEPVVFIGRLPENHIPITNMGISRRHAKIELDPSGGYELSDLNSMNGTFVNGKRVKKAILQHGDKIAIGKYTIVYEDLTGNASAFMETMVVDTRPEEFRPPVAGSAVSVAAASAPFPQAVPQQIPPMPPPPAPSAAQQPAAPPAPPAESGAVLIDTSSHVVYRLDRSYLTIGADEEDDIYAGGFMVNKGFAAVEQRDGGFYINTLKVMSKFKINGKSTKSQRLEHRDRIEIGSNTFRFMENG